MPEIAINLVRYNQKLEDINECLTAALSQDYPSYTVTLTENGSKNSIEQEIRVRFADNPKFRFADNHANLGFAGAHNKFFAESAAEFVMPLNPDAIMQPGFLSELIRAFDNLQVAAAAGKMLKPVLTEDGSHLLDGTGIIVSRSRRARERGQLQIDKGQYDNMKNVFGVSGTAPLYRKSALEKVKIILDGAAPEYFDEDFFMYWEDFDLSWRLRLAGYLCEYVPDALILHQRVGGQSKYGYLRPMEFAKHHKQFPTHILRYNWRNHLFAIIKNDFGSTFWRDFPLILGREVSMLGYICIFEPRTLGAVPTFFKLLPRMLRKRKIIQSCRVVDSKITRKWFLRKVT
jgi:GT2 family glycosyltransferase